MLFCPQPACPIRACSKPLPWQKNKAARANKPRRPLPQRRETSLVLPAQRREEHFPSLLKFSWMIVDPGTKPVSIITAWWFHNCLTISHNTSDHQFALCGLHSPECTGGKIPTAKREEREGRQLSWGQYKASVAPVAHGKGKSTEFTALVSGWEGSVIRGEVQFPHL